MEQRHSLGLERCKMSSDLSNDFTLVEKRKKKRPQRLGKGPQNFHHESIDQLVQKTLDETLYVEFYRSSLSLVLENIAAFGIKPSALYCIGLGSLRESATSRRQWQFLKAIITALANCECIFCEPLFTDEEKIYLQNQGYRITEKIPDEIDSPTLFYMPRCPRHLYESLLRANWSKAKLVHLFFIGNSLAQYMLNEMTAEGKEKIPCIIKSNQLMVHQALSGPTSEFKVPEGFNDMAIYWFSKDAVSSAAENFWQLPLLNASESLTDA